MLYVLMAHNLCTEKPLVFFNDKNNRFGVFFRIFKALKNHNQPCLLLYCFYSYHV